MKPLHCVMVIAGLVAAVLTKRITISLGLMAVNGITPTGIPTNPIIRVGMRIVSICGLRERGMTFSAQSLTRRCAEKVHVATMLTYSESYRIIKWIVDSFYHVSDLSLSLTNSLCIRQLFECMCCSLLWTIYAVSDISDAAFHLSSSSYTFDSAQYYCLSMGMHLASIHSDAENSEASALCNGNCWTGGSSVDQTYHDFTWTDGSQWDYTNWNTNEPNNQGGNEDCVHLWTSGTWNDIQCSVSYKALCRVPGTRDNYVYVFKELLYYQVDCRFILSRFRSQSVSHQFTMYKTTV